MPRMTEARKKELNEERQAKVLAYLYSNRGGKDVRTIRDAIGIGGEDIVRTTLRDMLTAGLVNVTHSKYSHAHGGQRTSYYHITPAGEEAVISGDVAAAPKKDTAKDTRLDWSVRPSLLGDTPAKDTVKETPKETVKDGTVKNDTVKKETPKDTVRKDTVVAPSVKDDTPDIDALGKALDTLRTLNVGDDGIDFDIGALVSKMEARITSSILPCPHCGGEMEMQSVGDNRMLVCGGCGLAVTWKHNPKDATGLVRAWNRRV